jgi:hypothetical protein
LENARGGLLSWTAQSRLTGVRRIWLFVLVIGVGGLEFASLRAGVGRGGRFPPESTGMALLVTVATLVAVGFLLLVGFWIKRRAERADRRLPYGMTRYRRSK